MRREGRRPVAARRRPESSGLISHFRRAGMTTWVIPASVIGAIGLTFRPALLDSSFRWNDGGGGSVGVLPGTGLLE